MFFVMGASLVTSGVTLRVLGSEDYGLYSVLGGIVAMFSFLNASLSGAVSRNLTYELGRGDSKRVGQIFNVSLIVFVCLAAIIVLLSESVGIWFFRHKMIIPQNRATASFYVLQLSILTVPISLSQIPYSAMLIAYENMKIYAYFSIADALVKLGIVYALFVSPFDKLVSYAVLGFAWQSVSIFFYRVYCMLKYPETKLRFCKDAKLYKGIFQFAGSDLIGNLSWLAQGQGINLLLNMFFGPVVNAARGIAYGLQGMTKQFSSNFMIAAEPQIVKSYAQGDFHGMWRLVFRSSSLSYCLVWVLALPALIEGDFVLRLWLGEYPEHTLQFFRLILVAALLETIGRPLVKVIHATGKVLLGNLTVGTILCLSFPVAYFCLKNGCAPESVFWCTAISMLIGNIMGWFVLRYYMVYDIVKYVLNVYGRCLLVSAVSAAIPAFVCTRIMQPCIIRMLLTGVITTLSVCLSMLFLGMNNEDRHKLLLIVDRRVRRRTES